jgi:hypothetical protein
MSRRRLACTFLGLALGVFFYLAYRSDYTVSNRWVSYLCGPSTYRVLKHELAHWLPIPAVLRGCMPSALWCFIATSLFGGWTIRISVDRAPPLAPVPPLLNAGWELVQWLGWTDGRADWRDVVAGFVGWGIARLLFLRPARPLKEISALWNWRLGVVVAGLGCIGLADVWK